LHRPHPALSWCKNAPLVQKFANHSRNGFLGISRLLHVATSNPAKILPSNPIPEKLCLDRVSRAGKRREKDGFRLVIFAQAENIRQDNFSNLKISVS
jgi:hypothetical protein